MYHMLDPQGDGVLDFADDMEPISMQKKPLRLSPTGRWPACTSTTSRSDIAASMKPSGRGEDGTTDVNRSDLVGRAARRG